MTPLPWSEHWHAWRLDRKEFTGTWDHGIGANKFGGRWNSPGHSVLYASADPATAILEVAVHTGFDALDTAGYVLTCFEVLDRNDIKVVQPEDIPNGNWLIAGSVSPNQQKFSLDTRLLSP